MKELAKKAAELAAKVEADGSPLSELFKQFAELAAALASKEN